MPTGGQGLWLGLAPTTSSELQATLANGGLVTQAPLFTSGISTRATIGSQVPLPAVAAGPLLATSGQAQLPGGLTTLPTAGSRTTGLFAHNEVFSVAAPHELKAYEPLELRGKSTEKQMGSSALRIGSAFGFRFKLPDNSTDVWFVDESTEGSRRIAAHKCVLSTFSPVFFRQFNREWKDMYNGEIPVPKEYKFEAFSATIDVMYGRDVSVDADTVSDMYALACAYKVDCVKWALAQSISQWGKEADKPMLNLFTMTHSAGAEEECELLKTAVLEYVHGHLGSLSENDALFNLSHDLVVMIAKSEDISASELDLCKFLSNWAAAHDTMPAKDLDEVFRHVRYGTIAYSEVLAQMATHKFFVGSGERFAIAYSQCSQLNLATLEKHASLFIPRHAQSCTTCNLPILSNTREQTYAFVFAGQRNVAIHASWNRNVPVFMASRRQPTIEVQVKSFSSMSRSESFCIELCEASTKATSNINPRNSCTFGGGLNLRGMSAQDQEVCTQPIHAFTLQSCGDGIKYCTLVRKEADPNVGGLHLASCRVISFAAPLPWLVIMKQKHMDQPLNLERI